MTTLEQSQTAALLDDRYQLYERVGEGGMAEIYRAEDVHLGRTVAIKLMRPDADVLASPGRARREADALAALNHPAVVTLLDARITPEQPRYLVMEFVDGPTLAVRLERGPLTPPEILRLAAGLAAGLQAVHETGLVHRDIKPSNILLAPPSTPKGCFDVKVADFGLAQLINAPTMTRPGVVLGTAAYIAPEQARGEPSGPASDIYSFGLVLLEALTGERPFSQADGIGVVVARILEDPAIPSDIDPRWAQLLRTMTAASPDDRPTAAQVVRALADLPEPRRGARTPLPPPGHESAESRVIASATTDTRPLPRRRHPSRARRPGRSFAAAASLAAAGLACAFAFGMGVGHLRDGADAGGLDSAQRVPSTSVAAGALTVAPPTVQSAVAAHATASPVRGGTAAVSVPSGEPGAGQNRAHQVPGGPSSRGFSGHAASPPNPPEHAEHGKNPAAGPSERPHPPRF